jgi:hypothetical protein
MSDTLSAFSGQHGGAPRALRNVGLAAVCIGLAALAAATFVLSYPGIHAVALQAGISPRLARGYPLLLDAMLVVVLAAVLSLRGAGLPSKVLAWLTLLALLGATASADALHAAKDKLPVRAAEITAAVLPWVLVLLAFVLLLAMLRHARLKRVHAVEHAGQRQHTAGTAPAPRTAAADILPGFHTLPGSFDPDAEPDANGSAEVEAQASGGAETEPDAKASTETEASAGADAQTDSDLAIDADASPGHPGDPVLPSGPVGAASPALSVEAEDPDPDMPVFHRIASSPTPPGGA